MKHLKFKLALVAMLLSFAFTPSSAYDFKVDGICYNVLSKSDLTCEVTSNDTEYSGNITIPEQVTYNTKTYSVTTIGEYAFEDCSGLTNVTIPNYVTTIGSGAFSYCSNLTSVTIPNSVTTVGSSAFSGCSKLTNMTIPNSVTTIGDYAFSDCSSLTNITIPNSVTTIDKFAFSDCSSLTNIAIPNSVTTIGDNAFLHCADLTSVTIPNSVTTVGSSAFSGCSGLTSVTIPNSVTKIGSDAFNRCTGLQNLTIADGSSELDLYYNTFDYCPLKNIYLGRNITYYTFTDSPFYGKKELTNLTISNSVTIINDYTFYYCTGLTSITIPNSVNRIGRFAFYDCSGLTDVTIGNSVTTIGEWAFEGCSALESVISSATTAPIAYEGTFSNTTYTNATLYIPVGSLPSYNSATCWKNFQIVEDDDITKVEGVGTGNTPVEIARYSLDGKKLLAPEKGINIIKMSDGTTRKVIVK